MARIKVTNTAIIVEDYIFNECVELEDYFSRYDPVIHKKVYFGLYYDKEFRRLYLPAGMDLWFVRNKLHEKYYDRILNHPYQDIPNLLMMTPPRDNEQVQALQFCCGIGDYHDNYTRYQLSLNLNTGKGKTYTSIATIAFFKIRSIIITASTNLLDQWRERILEYTNLKNKEIINISGASMCNMIILKKSRRIDEGCIFLCTHKTLQSYGSTYGWDRVGELFKALGIGIKIFDEAHENFQNIMMVDYFTNVYKTMYVTATAGRSEKKENYIFNISLKNVPFIDLWDENDDPRTHYIAVKYNSNPTPQQISRCKNKYGLDIIRYVDYITKNEEFYKMLRIITAEWILKCKGKTLIYIRTNEAILRVYYWLATNFNELLGDIGIFTSLIDKDRKNAEKDKRVILTTIKSAGAGQDIKDLKLTIVLAEPFKSDIIARQTLGRTRDYNTIYIDIVDLGFRYTKKFYYEKLRTFNKYALDVSDSTLTKNELDSRSRVIENERLDWRPNLLVLDDKRFDFTGIKKEESGPTKLVTFIEKEPAML